MFSNKKYSEVTNPFTRKNYVKMDLIKTILDEQKIPFIKTQRVEHMSHVKGYHVYQDFWTPVIGKCLLSEREPDNPEDKYVIYIKKENKIVGHLPLETSGRFAKTIFYFLRADMLSSCKIVITGKPVNFGGGYGMQAPCKLLFSGVKKCLDIFQKHVIHKSVKYVVLLPFFPSMQPPI